MPFNSTSTLAVVAIAQLLWVINLIGASAFHLRSYHIDSPFTRHLLLKLLTAVGQPIVRI